MNMSKNFTRQDYEMVSIRVGHGVLLESPRHDEVWYDYRHESDQTREREVGLALRVRQYTGRFEDEPARPDSAELDIGRDDLRIVELPRQEDALSRMLPLVQPNVPPGVQPVSGLAYYLDAWGDDLPERKEAINILTSIYDGP
jgi:hypothetical protein